jgi:hypothetical protein
MFWELCSHRTFCISDKQRSIKHTHKTKDRVTRTPLKTPHGQLKIELHDLHSKSEVNSGAPEGWEVPAPRVTLLENLVIKTQLYNTACNEK